MFSKIFTKLLRYVAAGHVGGRVRGLERVRHLHAATAERKRPDQSEDPHPVPHRPQDQTCRP